MTKKQYKRDLFLSFQLNIQQLRNEHIHKVPARQDTASHQPAHIIQGAGKGTQSKVLLILRRKTIVGAIGYVLQLLSRVRVGY